MSFYYNFLIERANLNFSRSDSDAHDHTTINSIPCEILTRIISYLPLDDRKNVRLTCRLWYECSTCLSITKNEKFVFRSGFSLHDIAKILLNPTFLRMNLEFQGLHIDSLPVYTWKSCGRRVNSLEFHDCRWSDKTIKNIILYCVDLTTFIIETSFCAAEHNLGHILCSPKLLSGLIEKGVQRTKLHTFTLFVDDVHLPSSVLCKIFQIYPCIKHFNTGTYSCEDSTFYCLVLHLGKEPVFSRLDKCLNNSGQLESLTFNIPTDGRWMRIFITEPVNDKGVPSLIKFESMIICTSSAKASLFDFFTVQKNLQVIRLALAECVEDFAKNLIYHMLENCPNLRELRVKFEPHQLNLTYAELPRFFALISKLRCLTLCFNVREEPFRRDGLPSLALNALRLDHLEINHHFCGTMLERCSVLRHLELGYLSDFLLQKIIKFLPNLETLVLNYVDDCTDYGFTGRVESRDEGYSIKRLQKLKHLELSGYSSVEITEAFVHELQLPLLETLNIGIGLYKTLSQKTLVDLASHVPSLRSLTIDELDEPDCLTKTVEFCRHFKYLHRLFCFESYLDEMHYNDENCIKRIFEACPSLRYISDSEFYMFSYNPFTGKVHRKTLENFKFRGSVFEGDIPSAHKNHVYYI